MSTILLYFTCVVIWGSTWFAITFQLGQVPPEVSIFYRFLGASLLTFLFCIIFKKPLKLSHRDHFWLMLQGFCMFSGSYIFTYYSEMYVTSGIVAVTFTLLLYFVMLGMRIFYGKKLDKLTFVSGVLGVMGVALIFYKEILGFDSSQKGLKGLGLALLATFISAMGNLAAVKGTKKKLAVIPSNAWGMFYGSILNLTICLILGRDMRVDFTPSYTLSLIYLIVFGTVIAFGAYISLIGTIGPERAAYTGILTPVIALIISTFFENYSWNGLNLIGVGLCILGNYLILKDKKRVGVV